MKKILTLMAILVLGAGAANAQANDKRINITNFSLYAKDAKIMVDWATDGTLPTYNWEVQRSTDGKEFETVGFVLGPDPQRTGDNYMFRDNLKSIKKDVVYYRLRHVSVDGQEQYSEIISASTK